nr:GNAT family N-acetyltransferase [Bartonella sp. B1099]
MTVSVKSCSLGLLLRLIAEHGLSAEVCSADELQLALKAGFTGDRIILDGSYKSLNDLFQGIAENALIHVDSPHELKSIIDLVSGTDRVVGLGLRLSYFYKDSQRSRFGVTVEEFEEEIVPLLQSCKNVYLKGFHLHIGSNLESPARVIENLRDWLPFLLKNMPKGGYLDMGSGFPADSFSEDAEVTVTKSREFFQGIFNVLSEQDPTLPARWKLVFEPSRYISEDHCYAVGRTVSIKKRGKVDIIQTNLDINWIPSWRVWHHSLVPLEEKKSACGKHDQILAGFNCFENDYLFPKADYGLGKDQLFIIRGCGSYDLQTANEWTRLKPPIYALYKKEIVTARLAENALPAGRVDLLHAEEAISVDKNIQLAPASSRYASELFNIIDRNRKEFNQYMAWPRYVMNEHDEAIFLDICFLQHQKNEGKTYAILFDEVPVGLLFFNRIDSGNKTAYIGYWLDLKLQGKGIITKSVKALMQSYLKSGKIKRFVIKCSVDNQRSNAVAQCCGFELEGRLRKSELLNGVFHDQNIYSFIMCD